MKANATRTLLMVAVLAGAFAAGPAAQPVVPQEWPLEADGFLEIEQPSGRLRVAGWDRPYVALTATGSPELDPVTTPRQFQLTVPGADSEASIDLRVPSSARLSVRGDRLSASITKMQGVVDVRSGRGDVRVDGAPREVALNVGEGTVETTTRESVVKVETSSASATVRSTGGRAEVSTVSGDLFVVAERMEGRFKSVSGKVEITGNQSRIRAESGSGAVDVDWREGDAEVSTVSGAITAVGDRFQSGRLESFSGDIRFASTLGSDGNLDVQAHQGSVDVDMPERTGDVTVSTESGPIRVTGDGLGRGRFESQAGDVRFEGTVEPSGALDVSTQGRVELIVPRDLDANFRVESRGRIRNTFGPGPTGMLAARSLAFTNGKGGAWISVRAGQDFTLLERPDFEDHLPSYTDSLYSAILYRIGRVDIDDSIDELQDLLGDFPSYAPGYHQLALLYLSKHTIRDRQRAEKVLIQAMRLDPDNVDYQTAWGELLWSQGFWYNSARHYEDVLEDHPDNAQAVYAIGRRYFREFLALNDRGPENGLGAGMWSQDIQRSRSEALRRLREAIELDPIYRPAYYDLGRLYLEIGRPDQLVATAEQLLSQFTDDKDALLFAALGYQIAGQETRASELYVDAVDQMGPEEREVMENVGLVASEEEADLIGSWGDWYARFAGGLTESPERSRFWRRQDPLYLTQANERRMAHYGRVAFANLAYGRPSDGTPGWQTDMGKSHIKFGRYLRRSASETHERWFYEGFSLSFRSNGLDDWSFDAMSSSGAGDFPALRRGQAPKPLVFERFEELALLRARSANLRSNTLEVFDEMPPRYVDPYLENKYLVPHQIARFRANDQLRLEVAYALPRSKVARDSTTGAVNLEEGIFVFDDVWDEVGKKIGPVRELDTPVETGLLRDYYVRHYSAHVRPEARRVVMETFDRTTSTIGIASMEEDELGADTTLVLSDLLLASEIRPLKPFPETRADLAIQPNPLRIYQRRNPLRLYFETYGLERDRFGKTRYEVSYQIGWPEPDEIDPRLFPEDEDLQVPNRKHFVQVEIVREQAREEEVNLGDDEDGRMAELIRSELSSPGRIVDYRVTYVEPKPGVFDFRRSRDKSVWETAVTAEDLGEKENDLTYLAIDVSDVPYGVHKLTVTVRDLVGRRETQRSALFRLVGERD